MDKYLNIFSLKEKTALVTGGLGILGKSFCKALCAYGADVVVIDLDATEVKDFSNSLNERYETNSIGLSCDITCPEQVHKCVEIISERYNSIDILHNNAQGATAAKSFEECTLEDWRKTSSVNEEGYFLMAQAVGKKMVEQGIGGSIIQTSSIYGILGPDQRIYDQSLIDGQPMGSRAVYSFTKAGVIGLTKYLATYWAKNNIRVNSITPGGVYSGQNDKFVQQYSSRVPLGRMAEQQDIVGALIYLASDASSYVTGQNLIIDGGLHAW